MGPSLDAATEALRRGSLVVYPTDTLVGLGALATHPTAVDRLVEAKGRPNGMPLSVAFSSLDEAEPFVELSEEGRSFCRRCLPGPYTMLVRASAMARRRLAPAVFASGRSLGFRIPDHPVARELARRAGPVVATSANRHGEPPAPDLATARATFADRVAVYVPLLPRPSGVPSRLVDLNGPEPREIARSGGPR